MPTKEQIERFIKAADVELGPECQDDWVEECRKILRGGDVQRQQIAWVVIRDYDYDGDALAGVHPTMEDAERQAEWMRKELGETRVEQWQMGEMEEMFTPPSNSPRSDK